MATEEFFRLFGVFESGGTKTDGQMLDREQVPDRIEEWLRKDTDLRTIQIVKVTRNY